MPLLGIIPIAVIKGKMDLYFMELINTGKWRQVLHFPEISASPWHRSPYPHSASSASRRVDPQTLEVCLPYNVCARLCIPSKKSAGGDESKGQTAAKKSDGWERVWLGKASWEPAFFCPAEQCQS